MKPRAEREQIQQRLVQIQNEMANILENQGRVVGPRRPTMRKMPVGTWVATLILFMWWFQGHVISANLHQVSKKWIFYFVVLLAIVASLNTIRSISSKMRSDVASAKETRDKEETNDRVRELKAERARLQRRLKELEALIG